MCSRVYRLGFGYLQGIKIERVIHKCIDIIIKKKSKGTRLWSVGISCRKTVDAAIFFGRLPGHSARLEKASSGFVFIAYNISDIRAHEHTCRVLKTGSSAWARPPVHALFYIIYPAL